MAELSPSAEAVLDAALPHVVHRYSVAAAFRAAADQVRYSDQLGLTGFGGYVQAQDQILAIAAELEAQ